jgi:hypothetical protein
MPNTGIIGMGNWIGILTVSLFILCFYFTLTFFEQLRKNEENRIITQSKLAATICIALALLIPVFYNFIIYHQMMK